MNITPEQIAELRRLEQAATAGPWSLEGEYSTAGIVYGPTDAVAECWEDGAGDACQNAALIAAMRNALPALLDALEERDECLRRQSGLLHEVQNERDQLRAEVDLLRGALAAQDERNDSACLRVGSAPHGCDTPEWLADEVLALRGAIAADDEDGLRAATRAELLMERNQLRGEVARLKDMAYPAATECDRLRYENTRLGDVITVLRNDLSVMTIHRNSADGEVARLRDEHTSDTHHLRTQLQQTVRDAQLVIEDRERLKAEVVRMTKETRQAKIDAGYFILGLQRLARIYDVDSEAYRVAEELGVLNLGGEG